MINKGPQLVIKMLVIGAFIAITSITLFYAFGYRYDYQNYEVVETGILRIPQKIIGAKILLNDQPSANQTPINIAYLSPGKYHIEILKENYYKWEQTVEITAGKVTEVTGINLIPQNANSFVSPLRNTSSSFQETFNFENSFGYLNNNIISIFKFDSSNSPIKTSFDINFATDLKVIALKSGKLLLNTNDTRYQYFNPNQKTLENSFTLPIGAKNVETNGSEGFYINQNNLFKFTLPAPLFNGENELLVGELLLSNITSFKIIDSTNQIFLITDINNQKRLIRFVQNSSKPINIARDVDSITPPSITGDIFFQKNNEIWKYNTFNQKQKFMTRFSQEVKHLSWHPNFNQILFIQNEQLKICDILFQNCYRLSSADPDSTLKIIPENNIAIFTINKRLHLINLLFS